MLSIITFVLCLVVGVTLATNSPDWPARLKQKYNEQPCQTDKDCLFLGDCVADREETRKCACYAGFTGSHCHELDLLPTEDTWGFNNADYPSWGGTILRRDGEYHLFASYMVNKCDLVSYGTNSAVLRATSKVPQGPYTFQEQILPPFHHGATILYDDKRKQYFLWADGINTPTRTIHDCTLKADDKGLPKKAVSTSKRGVYQFGGSPHDFISMATSDTLVRGNWTQEIIMRTDLQAGVACNRTNPSPVLLEDGSVLLSLRTTFCSPTGYRPVCHADSDCEHVFLLTLKSPVETVPKSSDWKRIKQLDGAEDPFLWIDREGRRHMLVHSKRACGLQNSDSCGLLASSGGTADDNAWISASRPAFKGTIVWRSTGRKDKMAFMQRPKILFDDDGFTPLFLICGVRRKPSSHVQTLLIPFNVPQNHHLRLPIPQPVSTQQHGQYKSSSPTSSRLESDDETPSLEDQARIVLSAEGKRLIMLAVVMPLCALCCLRMCLVAFFRRERRGGEYASVNQRPI